MKNVQCGRPARFCCDGRCSDNQGRGGCPAIDIDSEPAELDETRHEVSGLAIALALVSAIAVICLFAWVVA